MNTVGTHGPKETGMRLMGKVSVRFPCALPPSSALTNFFFRTLLIARKLNRGLRAKWEPVILRPALIKKMFGTLGITYFYALYPLYTSVPPPLYFN